MFVFWKVWRALFSCNDRFEIHPFVLLPTFRLVVFVETIILLITCSSLLRLNYFHIFDNVGAFPKDLMEI